MASATKHARLVGALKDAEREAENEESLFLVELVTAATSETTTEYTLNEIHQALLESQAWNILDPLNLFPLLTFSDTDGTQDLIELISLEGNPKEAVIAVQETLERLEKSETGDIGKHASKLVQLLGVCTKVIPRLKLRQKGPTETLRPILTHLGVAIDQISPQSGRDEGRRIISSVPPLIKAVSTWAAQAGEPEHATTNEMLLYLLEDTLSAYEHRIQASLTQRRFEALSPRLVLRSSVDPDSEIGVEVVQEALNSARALGFTPGRLTRPPSLGQLILFAHASPESLPKSPEFVQSLLPVLTSSLQQNIATDESLALLLTFISSDNSLIPEDIVKPIAGLLTPIASTHPLPPTRHVAFRILGRFLSRTPAPVRLAHLSSLLTDCPFPQMRVAAVGLVKEAFLDAISSTEKSLFASPTLIRALGPTLFRPDPEDLFSSPTAEALKGFLESSEPARLTECLAFYYILLKRDTKNLTGIRDRDLLRTVENGLLAPLRKALPAWLHDSSSIQDPHASMPLASLEMSLGRVDGAITSLG